MKNLEKKSPSRKKQLRKRQLYASILLALPALVAQANTYTWTGAIDQNIWDENNWQLSSPETDPDGNERLVLNTTGVPGSQPEMPMGDSYWSLPHGISSLYVGSGSGEEGRLNIDEEPGASYINSIWLNRLEVGSDGGKGVVNLHYAPDSPSGGNFSKIHASNLNIGSGSGAEGVVNVLGSGKSVQSQSHYGSSLEFESSVIGANGGKGTLNINGAGAGSSYTHDEFILGSGAGAEGIVNVLGGGKLTVGVHGGNASVVVADNGGQGALHINGQSASGDTSRARLGTGFVVGRGAGSQGQVTITQGGELITFVSQSASSNEGIDIGVDGGTGSVLIDGAGSIWKVAGRGSMTWGETDIGELHVGKSGTGELTVANSGVLSLGKSTFDNIYDPDIGMSWVDEVSHEGGLGVLYLADEAGSVGIINIGASEGQAAQGTGILDVKEIEFGAGQGVIVFNHTNNTGNYTFDTPLKSGTGQGIVRQVAGVTTLAQQNDYTGDIEVKGGELRINGTQTITDSRVSGGLFNISGHLIGNSHTVTGGQLHVSSTGQVEGPVNVSGSGILSGTGKAGDVVIENGGAVSPGELSDPVFGDLTVDSITFRSNSVYLAHAHPDGRSDLITAVTADGGTGTIDIQSGAHVRIEAGAGTWKEETRYTILSAENGVTGTFTNIETNLAFLEPNLEYDPVTGYLYLRRNSTDFGDVGGTYNQINTGEGAQGLGKGHPVYDAIVSMSADQARASYDNLSGEIHASHQAALLTNSRYARTAVNNHLSGLQLRQQDPHKNLWVSSWAHDGYLKSDANAQRLDNKGYGFLVGADVYDNGTTTIGMALGYERTKTDIGGNRVSNAQTDAVHALVYGRSSVGPVDIQGGIGYSWLDTDTTRHIGVNGLNGKSKAGYDGGLVQIFAQGSHTFDVTEQIQVTPYLGVAYQRLHMDSFTEDGSPAALHGRSNSHNIVTSTVGVHGGWQVSDRVAVRAGLGWQHSFGSVTPDADVRFANGANFNIHGTPISRNSVLADIGATFELRENMYLSIGYEGEFGNQSQDNAVKALFRWSF